MNTCTSKRHLFGRFFFYFYTPPSPTPSLSPSAGPERSGISAACRFLRSLTAWLKQLRAEWRWVGRCFLRPPPSRVGRQACNKHEHGPRGGGMLMLAHCGTHYAFMEGKNLRKYRKIRCPHTLRAQRGSAEVRERRRNH